MNFDMSTFLVTIITLSLMVLVGVAFYSAGYVDASKIAYDCYTNAADVDVCQSRLEDIIWPRGK